MKPRLDPYRDVQETRRLEPRLDVKIGAHRFLRINAFGEIDANEPVHERRADTSATQSPPRMREVAAIACPAEVPEHDLAEPDRARADLGTRHPERIANRCTGLLTTHRLNSTQEELLLNRQPTARCACAQGERAVKRTKPVRQRRLQQAARIIERARRPF